MTIPDMVVVPPLVSLGCSAPTTLFSFLMEEQRSVGGSSNRMGSRKVSLSAFDPLNTKYASQSSIPDLLPECHSVQNQVSMLASLERKTSLSSFDPLKNSSAKKFAMLDFAARVADDGKRSSGKLPRVNLSAAQGILDSHPGAEEMLKAMQQCQLVAKAQLRYSTSTG